MPKRTSEAAPLTPVPAEVRALVERFADHREAYRRGTYNEAQLRREFIDPLFKALGWDIDNTAGYAEAYKDVIHEDSIRIGGAVKAPDYCFRIGGARKFFLEAKKPSVDIKGDPTPAYQLRRYAWSGKLPLSILTDFEEFAVYDCRVKPDKGDKSSTARIAYYTFEQFTDPKVWGEIASVFSREAILKGSFDRYAQSTKRKRGTAEVDDAFLAEIEQWRDELARNIALRNPDITQRQLNTAVQLTVDRIIFLRICEDRGIEDYGRLQALLNGDRVYKRLFELFEQADQRYNSGLFYFQAEAGRGEPDTLTPRLTIDDKVLKAIIRGLYYPDSPYEFSVLSADILGHVYEQFLGKVIRLTKGHRAQIEEKPEVRKAGGVYYTPTYIVDYIVTHTVGKLLEGASVKWIGSEGGRAIDRPRLSRTLRVLDPACGSGSFLIGAYQYLLDWHLGWYMEHEPEKWAKKKKPPIAANPRGEYRLTIPERKRILLEHIYGVDIDAQAVEVTKLSLLLKVLEGETAHSLGTHLWYEKERALPDLSGNIKCGNSLIGPDFYDGRQLEMFDEEERYRINAFDWQAEFPEVFAGSSATASRAREEAGAFGSTSRARQEAGVLGSTSRAREEADGIGSASRARQEAGAFGSTSRAREEADGIGSTSRAREEADGIGSTSRAREEADGIGSTSRAREEAVSDKRFTTKARRNEEGIEAAGDQSIEGAKPPLAHTRGSSGEGGFDAVIGNPPYVLLQDEFRDDDQLTYFRSRYKCASYKLDTYHLFMERALRLVRDGGWASMITPANFLTNNYLDTLRRFLLANANIDHILVVDGGVFHGISVDNAIWVLKRTDATQSDIALIHASPSATGLSVTGRQVIARQSILNDPHSLFTGDASATGSGLWERCLIGTVGLGEIAHVNFGKQLRNRKVYTKDVITVERPAQIPREYRPCYTGRDVDRFRLRWGHLACLNDRVAQEGGCWDDDKQDARGKLITRQIGRYPAFALDENGYQCLNTVFMVNVKAEGVNPLYLLGILNSRLMAALWLQRFYDQRRTFPKIKGTYLKLLPIRLLDSTSRTEKAQHDLFVSLVQRMLDLHKSLGKAKTAHERTVIERDIAATDRQIDRLVYDLYGLTEEEIAVVEEGPR